MLVAAHSRAHDVDSQGGSRPHRKCRTASDPAARPSAPGDDGQLRVWIGRHQDAGPCDIAQWVGRGPAHRPGDR